jgi:hypothetical protein
MTDSRVWFPDLPLPYGRGSVSDVLLKRSGEVLTDSQ